MRLPKQRVGVLKSIGVPILIVLLSGCTALDYFLDVGQFCEPGLIHVQYVEIATNDVRVRCVDESQLDVLNQDSTIQVIEVGQFKGKPRRKT